MKIFYCCITKYPEETLPVIRRVKPYVDEIIIIHQYTIMDSVKKEFEDLGNCHLFHIEWNEDFSRYRTQYIIKCGNVAEQKGYNKNELYMLITDPDEFPSIPMLENIINMATKASLVNASIVTFNSHDIFVKGEGTDIPITFVPRVPESITKEELLSNSTSTYYKELLVKYQDGLKYDGKVHHTLIGNNLKIIQAPKEYYYEHIKTDMDLNVHGIRNFWIGGGGIQEKTSKWREMKNIASKYGIETWEQLHRFMKIGNVPSDLKQFWIDHRNDNDRPHIDSELRSFFKYYFFLHPNELKIINKSLLDKSNENLLDKKDNEIKQTVKTIITDDGIQDPRAPYDSQGEIEQFVHDTYMKILLRDPDPGGKATYTKLIKQKNIKRENLVNILRNSQEYKDKYLDT